MSLYARLCNLFILFILIFDALLHTMLQYSMCGLYTHYRTKVGDLLTNKTVSCLKAISLMRAFLIYGENDCSTVNFHLQKRLVFYHRLISLYRKDRTDFCKCCLFCLVVISITLVFFCIYYHPILSTPIFK